MEDIIVKFIVIFSFAIAIRISKNLVLLFKKLFEIFSVRNALKKISNGIVCTAKAKPIAIKDSPFGPMLFITYSYNVEEKIYKRTFTIQSYKYNHDEESDSIEIVYMQENPKISVPSEYKDVILDDAISVCKSCLISLAKFMLLPIVAIFIFFLVFHIIF